MVVISKVSNMFWGVTIDAGKFYSQTVTQGFHLSMAALEPGSASKDHVQVMLQNGSSEFLLCSLHQEKLIQQPLDLVFASGEELSFSLTGKGVVHLTGYLLEDQPEDFDDYSDEEESYDEEESDAPQLVEIDADQLKSGSKRKAIDALSPAKKQKFLEAMENDDEDEDDDDYNGDGDDDDDELSEDFSEDELTFDEDDDSDLDDMEDEEEVQNKSAKKSPVKTPKGDNTGSAKKDKAKGKIETTPQKGAKTPTTEKKENSQKKQNVKAPVTPTTPANGETPSKKKKKKKSKDGDASMNESTASTPGKSSTESTPKSETKGKKQKEGTPKANTPGKRSVLAGGTVTEELKVGHGPEAKAGKMVSVYYVGTLSKNNKQFDSCSKGKPFKFRLKQGEVIKGWDNGVEGMKVGGKRKITVPASQAYGNLRQGPIPPNSSLTFEVELKAIS